MSSENPWHGLPKSNTGHLQARRVDPNHPHDFFWACNAEGRYELLLALKEEPRPLQSMPQIRGITIQLYPEQRQLQLVLLNAADWEMFVVVCRDLIEHTRSADASCVMQSISERLVRWQRLLSRGPRKTLDEREIRGLVAELAFLRDELLPRMGPSATSHWQGPQGKPQDFVVGPVLFEIKSVRHGDSPRIRISSPDQLWSGGKPLYLQVITVIDSSPGAEGAVTLPSVISDITAALSGTAFLDTFEECLALLGYVDHPEYANVAFCLGPRSWYSVTNGFPMIVQSGVPAGIVDVAYSVLMSACEPFRVPSPDWGFSEEIST